MAVLKIDNLSYDYITKAGKVHALKEATASFDAGTVYAIVARAIATDPEMILADEPTGNLDNENSMNVVSILVDLAHKYGKCVIIITHAAEVAEKADVMLRMDDGILRR